MPGDAARPDAVSPRASSSLRAPWFDVSCCPTNIGRTLACLGGYVATADDGGVQIHQFAPATIDHVPTARRCASRPAIRGPARSSCGSSERRRARALSAARARLGARGDARRTAGRQPGYARLRAAPMAGGRRAPARAPAGAALDVPDPRVDAVRGCVAAERGPLVYCLESTDQEPDVSLADVLAPPTEPPARRTLPTRSTVASVPRTGEPLDGTPTRLTFIPYHAWGNRGLVTMRVWVPAA